jgi:hypothetical protein
MMRTEEEQANRSGDLKVAAVSESDLQLHNGTAEAHRPEVSIAFTPLRPASLSARLEPSGSEWNDEQTWPARPARDIDLEVWRFDN